MFGLYYNNGSIRKTSLLLTRFKISLASARTRKSPFLVIKNTRDLKSIALRREDKSRWERRVALTPNEVSSLIKDTGVDIYVQPCNKRVFNNDSYLKAGAMVQEDVSNADIIIGIKEVPIKNLIPNKTYIFFSHTHKGQLYNMGMLKDILDKKIHLIDYELMTDDQGKRLVLFGAHAGYSGMIDGLHGLGLRLLGLGYNTPFMHLAMSHSYKSLDNAIAAVKELGNSISEDGLPSDFHPITFVFTGTGNVSKGAQYIFQNLPHEYIDAKHLKECVSDKHKFSNKKIYGCQIKLEDYLIRKDTGKFESKSDYYSNPDKYLSEFHSRIAPYTSMLVHGSYWDAKFPRLITTKQLQEIQSNPSNKNRLLCIADISCDINGALEFLSHSTTIEDPFYYVDAINNKEHKNDDGKGTQMMAVDILPTEIPLESSKHFSKSLYPFMKDLINDNIESNLVLSGATIAKDGKLMDEHEKLYELLPKSTANNNTTNTHTTTGATVVNIGANIKNDIINNRMKKKILLLGSGFVAKPLVDRLSAQHDLDLIIASNVKKEAIALTHGNPNIQIVDLDVNSKQDLGKLVEGSDVVVSLVPAPLHPIVAEQCIIHRKHMITASYISPEMKALDELAKQADITILNEIGVDPGIDHLSAMKIIDEVKDEGGEITSFVSWCGGLPAPEASKVPLGYKFSWSPKGVLTAALNDAKFWMKGKYQEIPGGDLLKSHFPSVSAYPGFAFEGLANRNSLTYIDTYGLSPLETKKAMFRGTLRYKGYSDLMYSFYKLGLLDTELSNKNLNLNSWSDFFDSLLFNRLDNNGSMITITESDRIAAISEKLNLAKDHYMVEQVVDSLKWLSLMPTPINNNTLTNYKNNNDVDVLKPNDIKLSSLLAPIDLFCILLQQKLKYSSHERDMLVLHHEFGIKLKNGQNQIKTSSLVAYGSFDTCTAMAKTVGLPSAIAAEMIARGEIKERGILSPTLKSIYLPILHKLEDEGIKIIENVEPYRKEMCEKLEWCGSGIWN